MNRSRLNGIGMTSQRTRERLATSLGKKGIHHTGVLEAIKAVPRHLFVDEALAHRAYEDIPLPIGFGQTISQPFVVARMTELLLSQGLVKTVLEIGTGSGYQTAVLAHLVETIYSIERIQELLDKARKRFWELGLRNIRLMHADGSLGWPEISPFDAILVTAAVEEVPRVLLEQLKEGGVLVAPVGGKNFQDLQLIRRTPEEYECTVLDPVRFVPLIRDLP